MKLAQPSACTASHPAVPPVGFTLPAAWRPGSAEAQDGALSTPVNLRDLIAGLTALAVAAGTGVDTVLLAAHLTVLRTLAGGKRPHTVVSGVPSGPAGPDTEASDRALGPPVAVAVARSAATWRDLVATVAADLAAASVQIGQLGDARYDLPPAAGALPPADPGEAPLRVGHHGHTLRLVTAPGAVAAQHLRRLAGMYRSVLEAMSTDPDGDARSAVLAAGERDRVLRVWGTGTTTARTRETVLDVVGRQAAATPSATAVRTAEADLTYREVEERSNRLARYLHELGVGTETLVGVCLRRGTDLLPVLLGIWKAGGAYLPLDPHLPPDRLARVLTAAPCPIVVTSGEHVPVLAGLHGGTLVLVDEDERAIAARPATAPAVRIRPDQLAYVMHTSGSTGVPKGVLVQHGGLVNYLRWTAQAYAAHRPGGAPLFSSLGFDLGIPNLFTPLLVGQPVHLLPEPLDVADLGRLLVDGGPYSFVKMTPGHLDLLTHQLTADQIRNLAGLAIAAGDSFPRSLAARWLALAGPAGTRVATEYGPTEVTIGNSGQPITAVPDTQLVPLGAPIPNTTMYILTEELEPTPVGVPGEIYIGGAGVSRGYLGRPELTADRFLPDPYGAPGDRLYRSGDLARWLPDGSAEFLGRADDQMKIRGYRIEPGEIRAALCRHPQVKDAVVLAHRGAADVAELAAFVLPRSGHRVDPAVLRAHLAGTLPEYMVPKTVREVERIPLTRNGKVDGTALRALLSSPARPPGGAP